MTERTVTKLSLRTGDDDSISLNSTQESEADEERSYVIDRILTEQDDGEGNKYYLILWDGYGLLASTWEPAENIKGQATLDDWNEEKMRVTRGLSKEFDVVAFEEELERLRSAKEERRERRKAKRERLGLATSFSESEEDLPLSVIRGEDRRSNAEADVIERDSEEHIQRGRRKPGSNSKLSVSKSASDTDEDDLRGTLTSSIRHRTINLPTQDHVADTSEDSFVEERKQNATKATAGAKRSKATTNRQAKDALSFVSDEASSLFRSASPSGVQPKSTQKNPKAEPLSRTGYQGTANRRAGAVPATSLAHRVPASRGATRGRPRGRGRGRGRGQETVLANTISFTAPNNDSWKTKRKRSLANAILNAPTANASKPIEHFKTASMARKAELAARSLPDRVPDMQSVGILSRPSDYGGSRPIRKKTQLLRVSSELDQSNHGKVNQSPAAFTEGSSKSNPSPVNEEMGVPSNRESEIQAEITERTAKIVLHKTNTPDQIMTYADRLISGLPQGTPTAPRTIIQEQANNPDRQPKTTDFNVTDSILHPAEPDDFGDSPQAKLQIALVTAESKTNQSSRPVTKINLKEYKSRRKSEFLGDVVPAHAIFGNNEATPMLIGLTDIDEIARTHWVPMLSGIGVLNFSRSCVAQEFQTQLSFLQGTVHATGNVITGAEGTPMLDEITERLRPCSGLIFTHEAFCILVFPARCEEWKFLDPNPDIDHNFRYQIYQPKSLNGAASQLNNAFAENIVSSLELKRNYFDTLVDLTQNLQYQTLLSPHVEGQDIHNFYIFFPRKAEKSAKYVVTWLRSCNPDCRIYSNQKPGSWDMFSNNPIFKAGAIVIHEYLLPSIFKIPHIARLINGNSHFNFWCMDDGSCANPFRLDFGNHDAVPSCEASMFRLFPHGGAVFLTPSFLITQPERTCDLLRWFQNKIYSSTHGTWKLVFPNEGRQYLLCLAVEKATAHEKLYANSSPEQVHEVDAVAANQFLTYQECKARFQSYVMLDQLLKKEHMAGVPNYWEGDSPDEFESPIIYADHSIDQDDEKALVAWFAGWTMLHLNQFRKFMVVGTTPMKGRANARPAKTTGGEIEHDKGQTAAVVQQPPNSQVTGSPVAATSRWNRKAFSEVKDMLSSKPTPPPKADELLPAQNQRSMSLSVDVPMDVGIDRTNPPLSSETQFNKPASSKSVSTDSRERHRTRHGIDEKQPSAILEFIAITGTEAETANRYLARYNGDVHTAVQRYWYSVRQSSSPKRLTQMDGADNSEDPGAVADFIAGTHASAQVAERYLYLAQDDVRRAIALYNESQQYSRLPSGGLPNHDGAGVRADGHEHSPSRGAGDRATLAGPAGRRRQPEEIQSRLLVKVAELGPEQIVRPLSRELEEESEAAYDLRQITGETQYIQPGQRAEAGEPEDYVTTNLRSISARKWTALGQSVPDRDVLPSYDGADERRNEDGSRLPRKSGIVTNEAGTRQLVPRSVRPSGTTRSEISIRPGHTPLEDKPICKNRRIMGGVPQYELEDTGNFSGGSRTSSTVQSPTGIETDTRRLSFPDPTTPPNATNNKFHLDPDFETTVEWYNKLRKNGDGWEHIYVGGWEACFPRLMNMKK